jgi:hypothetical protein
MVYIDIGQLIVDVTIYMVNHYPTDFTICDLFEREDDIKTITKFIYSNRSHVYDNGERNHINIGGLNNEHIHLCKGICAHNCNCEDQIFDHDAFAKIMFAIQKTKKMGNINIVAENIMPKQISIEI